MTLKRCCIFFFIFFLYSSIDSGGINLGPLYNTEINSDYERQYNALGPIFTFKKKKDRTEYGIRPLYYRTTKERGDVLEYEFVYPFGSYKRKENFTWFQGLVFFLVYNTQTTQSGYKNKEFNLFPFIFSKRYENPEDSYFALFPIYGTMKNKFFKERITFFLFPLYLDTYNEGERTTSSPWPIASRYTGDTEGYRLWPFYGTRTNVARQHSDKFILWPFYVKREKLFYGEKFYFTSYFPVYSKSYFHGVYNRGYIWPFVQHTKNYNTNTERWDVPWPLINFSEGETNQQRVLPFYSKKTRPDGDEDGFILWPIYRYKTIKLESYRRYRKSFVFFLYRDVRYEPIVDGYKPKRNIDLWPIFSYEKTADGKKKFHFLSLLEPLIRSNERLYRNWASYWRLFVWEKSEDNVTRYSFLWNLISSYKDDDLYVFDIRPIIPLFNITKSEVNRSWTILGGLLGYGKKDGKNILKLLYVPIKV